MPTAPTMTHGHYEFIARTVRSYLAHSDASEAAFQRARLAHHFAKELKATNPRFNSDRFIIACGVVP